MGKKRGVPLVLIKKTWGCDGVDGVDGQAVFSIFLAMTVPDVAHNVQTACLKSQYLTLT